MSTVSPASPAQSAEQPARPFDLLAPPPEGASGGRNLFAPFQARACLSVACDAAAAQAGLPALQGLSVDAAMQLALQRTAPIPGSCVKAWAAGDDGPLRAQVESRGPLIVASAIEAARADAEEMAPHLDCVRGGTLVDIGCGHGLVTAFLSRMLSPAEVILVDIEQSAYRGHFWGAEGAGYAQLSIAGALCAAEGPAVRLVNPTRDPLPETGFDAAISTWSCGFHYPVGGYAEFFAAGIRPGGAVSLDLRMKKVEREMDALAALSRIAPAQEIGRTPKMRRMLFRRPAGPAT
ncbi:class I SAM-dependent methyltransferase [Rhodovulum sp. DZ06]|uniref:class I SAM-dependent methyltransferase n=1 Tax=Rhodovulum sp. DZ06 TaxID=3425126 RepID=UPI003D338458